jgi:hypothetical protein
MFASARHRWVPSPTCAEYIVLLRVQRFRWSSDMTVDRAAEPGQRPISPARNAADSPNSSFGSDHMAEWLRGR